MTVSEFASLSTVDLVIAEVQGKVKVTRLTTVKPRSSDLVMSQTKGNRCRTNRSSGTNFVTQVRWVRYTNSPEQDYKLLTLTVLYSFFVIMSNAVALALLAQGNTGNEILSLLDVIVSEETAMDSVNEPTADRIEFW